MDMKQYREHLSLVSKTTLTESASPAAAKTAKALEEFERASKNLLAAWSDLIDETDSPDIQHPDKYPFQEDFEQVVQDISAFTKHFSKVVKQVK